MALRSSAIAPAPRRTKPHVEVKSFPSEAIGPLVANSEGTCIVGGGLSGTIFLWVASGKLLIKWSAHLQFVNCLVLSDDESMLISGGMNAKVKVWSLPDMRLLRSISFPSTINVLALDPGEDVFCAGSEDDKIYIAALHGMFVIDALCDKRFAITCFAMSTDGITLVSGSKDGNVRVWDTRSKKVLSIM